MMSDGVTSVETTLLGFSGRIDNLDAFTLLHRGVTEDLNTALDYGFYAIGGTATNLPAAEFAFGNLVVLGGYYKTQIAFSVESTQRMAIRKSVSDTWRK